MGETFLPLVETLLCGGLDELPASCLPTPDPNPTIPSHDTIVSGKCNTLFPSGPRESATAHPASHSRVRETNLCPPDKAFISLADDCSLTHKGPGVVMVTTAGDRTVCCYGDAGLGNTKSGMDLEDHFYRLRDQHLHLKKEAIDAKNQVRILNTRVARLLSDKKNRLRGQRTAREVELEEVVFDMNSRLSELERENFRLKEKGLLLRTQLVATHPHRDICSAYAHVAARVDSGLRRRPTNAPAHLTRRKSFSMTSLNKEQHFSNNGWQTRARPMTASRGVQVSKFGAKHESPAELPHMHFLLEARDQIKNLERIIANRDNNRLTSREAGESELISHLRSRKNKDKTENGHDTDSGDRESSDRRISLMERQSSLGTHVPDQSSALAVNENHHHSRQCLPLKPNIKLFRGYDMETHGEGKSDKVVTFVESLKEELSQEKEKNSQLEKQILSCKVSTRTLDELKQRVHELQEENQILQESLRKCVGSCFSEMKGSSGRRTDASLEAKRLEVMETMHKQMTRLQDKVKQLESEKSALHQQLLTEQETVFKLDEENAKLSTRLEELVIGADGSRDMETETGPKCQRTDHSNMESQLTQMQKERTEVLREFSEMRQMLETIQSNIHRDDPQEDGYEDDFEDMTASQT